MILIRLLKDYNITFKLKVSSISVRTKSHLRGSNGEQPEVTLTGSNLIGQEVTCHVTGRVPLQEPEVIACACTTDTFCTTTIVVVRFSSAAAVTAAVLLLLPLYMYILYIYCFSELRRIILE